MIQFDNFIFIVANAIFKICIHGIIPLLEMYLCFAHCIKSMSLNICTCIKAVKIFFKHLLASDTKRKKGKMIYSFHFLWLSGILHFICSYHK